MSISPSFLEEIRNRLTLSEIIGKHVKVTRAGREYKACCPFHREKTPSFTINNDKQFYHCFGCGAHGDVLKFTMEHEGLGFIEAVESLAALAGLQMPAPDPAFVKSKKQENDLYAMMSEAADWFVAQLKLPANKDVQGYLDQRGLSRETQEMFRIGLGPSDGQALRKHLAEKGYKDKDMMDTGLLKASSKGGEPYIFFRDRVMFPVIDRRGRVVAFGGRTLPDHLLPPQRGDFKPPKYINSPDTRLFDKGKMLYGEWLARPAAREGHTMVVTEGYMDVIACYAAGFKGAVAPMGTALTDEQILTLWQIADSANDPAIPVLCFDGDNAGRRAAVRAADNLMPLISPGKSARIAFLPNSEDPDSLIKNSGSKALKNVLSSAIHLFEFLWQIHTQGKTFTSPEQRAALSKALNEQISRIRDGEVQRHYKELIRTRIDESFFKPRGNFQRKGNFSGKKQNTPKQLKPRSPMRDKNSVLDSILLAAILNNPELINDVEEQFGSLAIAHPAYNNLRQAALFELQNHLDIEITSFHNILRSKGFAEEMDDILGESVYVHAAFCRPGAIERLGHDVVRGKWQEIYNQRNVSVTGHEVRSGWVKAVLESDSEQENRLMDCLKQGSSDSAK
ncbi:MAG: DNA primase [Micavibrio sp.]|nr:DNA primase [Micavibrio sp.]